MAFIVLAIAAPALAVEAPKAAVKPALKRMFTLRTPSAWMLEIHDDGSGRLMFGASIGNQFPAGTFKPADVRKSLEGLKLDPDGREGSHFIFWYEEERKSPADGPPARYTQNEDVIVPLFEKAAAACKETAGDRLLESLFGKRPRFGLKK